MSITPATVVHMYHRRVSVFSLSGSLFSVAVALGVEHSVVLPSTCFHHIFGKRLSSPRPCVVLGGVPFQTFLYPPTLRAPRCSQFRVLLPAHFSGGLFLRSCKSFGVIPANYFTLSVVCTVKLGDR